MTKQARILLALAAVLALLAAACGDDSGGGSQSDVAFRVGIVSPSAANDLAFTQSIVDAVEALRELQNLEISVTGSAFDAEGVAAPAIRGYAADGFDLVIAHGSQYGDLVQQIAPEYPDVAFAWGTASDTFDLPNVYAYDAAADQGGYVLGAMSAMLSSSGVVGVVGPIEVGDAQRYVNGFKAGAGSESSSVEVRVEYTGSFSDLALAAEVARSHLDAGADVLTGSAQMVVGAVAAGSERGALWFGNQADQSSLDPWLVVASQVYHWEVILRLIINDIEAGGQQGKSYSADLANGGMVIEYNPSYGLPDAVRQRADQIIADMINGSVTAPVVGG